MTMADAAPIGDIFCTLTGNVDVLRGEHFSAMKDGAVICNSGHFNVEIDIPALEKLAGGKSREVRNFVQEYMVNGKHLFLLGDGRLINLAAAEGHPASVMDMSFANQALGAEYLIQNAKSLGKDVHRVPEAVDREIARLKLQAMGSNVDLLTPAQQKYLASWDMGT
jgi:adenosylhomocysteinase